MCTQFDCDCWNRKFSLTKAGSWHLGTGPSVLIGHSLANNADVYSGSRSCFLPLVFFFFFSLFFPPRLVLLGSPTPRLTSKLSNFCHVREAGGTLHGVAHLAVHRVGALLHRNCKNTDVFCFIHFFAPLFNVTLEGPAGRESRRLTPARICPLGLHLRVLRFGLFRGGDASLVLGLWRTKTERNAGWSWLRYIQRFLKKKKRKKKDVRNIRFYASASWCLQCPSILF